MKSGFVTIIGRPNVGKSTLLNAIINHKVSIVTDKSQTTRNNILGIYNGDNSQIIFVDTPGIHKPRQKLGEEMNQMALTATKDVDALMLVIDASKPFGTGDEFVAQQLPKDIPLVIVVNKIDLVTLPEATKIKEACLLNYPNAKLIETVATDRFNLDEIISYLTSILPEGPQYYPTDVITDKDEIFLIKEIIREKILKQLRDEVPHSIAIYMENIEWEDDPIHIQASIIVEKDSQKGIVIGAGGKRIKQIGISARKDIEHLLKKHAYLELFVKVQEDWRNLDSALETYGYKNDKN